MTILTHRKVKSGCRTCKLRKVKCDEGWPICNRCKSTGRTCDGYGIWGGGGKASQQQQEQANNEAINTKIKRYSCCPLIESIKSIGVIKLETNEEHCFEWFRYRSAVKLQGIFYSAQWANLLLEASTTESAIRHAVLALASAHKEEVQGFGSRVIREDSNELQVLFTFRQYNKAISNLRSCFADSGKTSLRVLLMSCILFVWMENLRGHYQKGILHLENGLSLLRGSGNDTEYQDPALLHVDGWIITIFTRLFVQARLLGVSTFPCRQFLGPKLSPNFETFTSIHHARRSLDHIMLSIFDLQEQSYHFSNTSKGVSNIELLEYQNDIHVQLQIWLNACERNLSQLTKASDFLECFAYHLLRLYYRLTTILAGTCLESENELKYDRHLSTFNLIIYNCIEIYHITHIENPDHTKQIEHNDPEPTSPNSVSDIGWIPLLYLTATKCRNHRIRHQAVGLLASLPHKEGIWNASLAVIVANKIIDIEEGDLYDYMGQPQTFSLLDLPTDDDLTTPSIPLSSRLNKVNVVLPDDRAGKLLLSYQHTECTSESLWTHIEYDLATQQWYDIT